MDSGTYYTLTIQSVAASNEETLTLWLFEQGASGVQENLEFSQKDKKYLPELVEADFKDLIVYFETRPDPDFFQDLSARYPELQVKVAEEQVKDWFSEWKAQWSPFQLVEDVWVVPEWEKENFDFTGKKAIFIEPGMAFGTGTHGTTRLASQLLVNLQTQNKKSSLLDVGTGSGILALLGHLLSFEKIYAFDNDAESFRVFQENRQKNHQPELIWKENWPDLSGEVDVCVANIIDGVLLDLKPQFKKLKAQYYIFTGVLEERENEFVKEMTEDWPLKHVKRSQEDEWVGFLFERPQ